jgi:hypothetical protein
MPALATFLAAACLIFVAGPAWPDGMETNGGMERDETQVRAQPPDSVVAYYFHRTYRCVRCITMEAYVLAVIHLNYSTELEKGTLRWHAVDYEDPANAHYAEKHEFGGPALVLSHWADGSETRWTRVDEIWELLDTPGTLVGSIDRNVKACLGGKHERGGPEHGERGASSTK